MSERPSRRAAEQPPVVSLKDADSQKLSLTGGKGANLTRLIDAGFPVPTGFCVTTAAYRALIDDSEIQTTIESLEELDPNDRETIATGSAEVRSQIQDHEIPESISHEISTKLDATSVAYAIRSSATAEDLPTASFAGQHETFLAVRGETAVIDRIRDCMASLFTDRAVTYRLRNGISHSEIGMAVVIQEMVEPEVAGVLFTADPVSGNRQIASIEASFGLGDAIVAGEVSPDNARVDRRTSEVIEYDVGEKARAIRSQTDETGGTEMIDVSPEERTSRTLTDAQLRTLVDLGEQIETLLGAPQDIEWALVDDEFVLLQSRPITSLYPLVSPLPDDEYLHVYLSFGHQQAMPKALPPLVVDFWREFLNNAAARFRPEKSQPWAVVAGSRVYADLTPLLRLYPLRSVIPEGISALSEPASNAITELLAQRTKAIPPRELGGLCTLVRSVGRGAPLLLSVVPRMAARFARTFVLGPPNLADERERFETFGYNVATRVRQQPSHGDCVRVAFDQFDPTAIAPNVLPRLASFIAAVVAGKVLTGLFPDAADDIDAVGKGFKSEIVTRMNQQLGDLADIAREYPDVATALKDGTMLAEVERVDGGTEFVDAFDAFLDEFGHRGTGEIDLSRPRWKDDPTPLLQTIRSNLTQTDSGKHRAHLHRLERDAEDAAARLEGRASQGLLGPITQPPVRHLIETYRGGIQLREYPKQGISHLFDATHEAVAGAGESLAADGRLNQPDDVWFLRKEELLAALDENGSIDVDVDARRRVHEHHSSLVAPPLMTNEGEIPTASKEKDRDVPDGTLVGSPVSTGVVEGRARVVRDPSKATLESGEILIAPATDPGWTPLFLNASALIMEVGGRMTHGALVAREYGIPAVASVANATREIQTGERIRIDGRRGTVELLDRPEETTSTE